MTCSLAGGNVVVNGVTKTVSVKRSVKVADVMENITLMMRNKRELIDRACQIRGGGGSIDQKNCIG